MQHPAGTAQALIKRLLARLHPDEMDAPGFVFSETRGIDDGSYGDPLRDERPDFIKDDEHGWTSLGRLDGR